MKTFSHAVLNLTKLAGIAIIVAALGACSQLPSLSKVPETSKETSPEKSSQDSVDVSASSPMAEPQPLTEEQQVANAINSKPDLFLANKKILAPDIKQSMRPILDAYQAGDYALAEQQMEQILNNELNVTSHVLVLAGDISRALSLQEASSGIPANTLISASEQKLNTAKNHYRRALSINQHNAKAANRLAKLLREEGDFEQAHALYSQAIVSQPSHAYSYRNRAVLNDLYLNRKADALSDYQTYAALLKHKESMQASENAQFVLTEAQNKALKKDLKMVGRWLADVQRQVNALARNKSENSNGS
ncbi:tetratricopeptide repeat protein [Glaciecola petra]|uniref:Tetratricopeptide repeat protein n=1 Tax=Glaciecola petra TaxID=3075602 RepID=A0ABU2ZSM3_9ALTE|nr:tetratricopeptide repeat protein [Aestuariibacter sp. P117]MDT0595028.1 tetratricopeptide repeat protein [Aestuariibacter sp. P117]